MARRSPRLPFATARRAPAVALTADDWARIEAAYGRAIPEAARAETVEATQNYIGKARFERAAEPVGDALAILNACEKSARALLDALRCLKGTDAGSYVAVRLKEYAGIDAAELIDILEKFPRACAMTRADIEQAKTDRDGFVDGEAWREWIVRLAKILSARGLPTGTSHDGLKTSPFAAFVRELQKCLPAEHRRARQSDGALAKAMRRALKAGG